MRDDFCAFILTHGRPDKVLTYRTLRRAGYTGKIFIVVDDEDKTRNQYMAEFGEQVLVFSKADIASRFDEADNFCDRRSIFYARNACFDLAKLVGCKYFIQLDDDYHEFQFRVDRNYDQAYFPIRKLDAILSEMLAYYESIPALSIAMSQGGDFLGDNGGHASWVKRKAMNSFICSVDRPFSFMGRINEDVNTYTNLGRCGELFMTIGAVQLGQKQTQKNSGGMTELYLDSGTYVKSFYSVMYAPSCVKISLMGDRRLQVQSDLPWLLVCRGAIHKFRCVPHLTGRRFEHGVTDCYTLFRDAYHLAGIEMPDFHRGDDWWRHGQNLYLDNLEATGFYRVVLTEAQPGDVLLCCFGSSVPNHAAIYCGDGELLHHIPEQLSKRERYTDKWQRRTHSLWRHRAWRASAFTGIYNDLAAASTFV